VRRHPGVGIAVLLIPAGDPLGIEGVEFVENLLGILATAAFYLLLIAVVRRGGARR
jgi:hypothetical protein